MRDCRALAFEDGGDAHPAGGADGDEAAARAAARELLGERGDDARAGGGEGMAERDARALGIQLRALDRAQRVTPELLFTEVFRLPGLQRAEHLRGEGLVDLVDVEVLEL